MTQGEENLVLAYTKERTDFEKIIEYYQTLLIENLPGHESMSKILYTFLFDEVLDNWDGKDRLLIMPDGMLNFLPFETLIDEQGHYLIEQYHITYTQSLGVLDLIQQRQYSEDRKPVLAFGGAVYDRDAYQADIARNNRQLTYLMKQVEKPVDRGNSLQALYASLGYGGWDNLPGTLSEVQEIQRIIQDTEAITGNEVNETRLKALSADGILQNYKIIHFATHAVTVPEMPEFSALVLSQKRGNKGNPPDGNEEKTLFPSSEDGYFRIGEIAQLNLAADVVTLSACETGGGRFYSGEGVVGLTQAFLLAGANSVAVSLWRVADQSTVAFMQTLYTVFATKNLSYAEAMTEVKRRFIAGEFGEAWKAPRFWAPFVYYGKG